MIQEHYASTFATTATPCYRLTWKRVERQIPKEAVPGVVVSIQTFGDLVNFHPHLHCLVIDDCFMANDWFYVLPEIDIKKLESLFRHKVLKLLLSEKRISEELFEKLLSWKNSGCNRDLIYETGPGRR
jgi:hypothetical protein